MEVSVLVTTYNHQRYIAQALDSVLMQETDFEYEIIVLEDCSTDATRDIVVAYQKRHPHKVRLRLATRNECSSKSFAEEFQSAPAPYIAMLDGDDYWTSPRKLQIQVDFLRTHPECVLCFHNALTVYEDSDRMPLLCNPEHQKPFSDLRDLWRTCFIPGCTPMLRKDVVRDFPEWYYDLPLGDWPLYMLYAQHGKIGYINEVLGVYRIHKDGFWSRRDPIQKLESAIEFYENMNANFEFRYDEIAQLMISEHKNELAVATRINAMAAALLPQDATVLVVSLAHQDLPRFLGRRVWAFPERSSKNRPQLFATGATGSAEAAWIQPGHTYKFSLYDNSSQARLLASVSVARNHTASAPDCMAEKQNCTGAFITANSSPISSGTGRGNTTISWSTGNGLPGFVYVSLESQRMQYPANGASAIEDMERLRKKGAEFLFAPRSAFILFERYPELKEHLDQHYPVLEDDEACRVYDLCKTVD